jgi:hypothetical protein
MPSFIKYGFGCDSISEYVARMLRRDTAPRQRLFCIEVDTLRLLEAKSFN